MTTQGSSPQQTERKIMIVEDDPSIRETLAEVLEEELYQVSQAADGREALTLLEQGARPDLLLLDLMMPVMTGWQLIDALRAHEELARIPVVVFSAAQGTRPLPGVREVLSKPVSLESLLAAIARHIA